MTDLTTRTAHLIRAYLRHHRSDLAAVTDIAATLGVTEATISAAAGRFADLGLCGPPEQPHVWWLPTPPLQDGFQPVYRRGHLVLQLAGPDEQRPPLHLAAHTVAAPPRAASAPELERLGLGPLGRTVSQLCLMTPATCEMFELIAHTWRSGTVVFSCRRLHVYQTTRPPTELELITWTDDHGELQLINLYPIGMHHLVFDTEEA